MGEEAWGGDWARMENMLVKNCGEPGAGEETREGGLGGDLSTLVGNILGVGENAGRVGELAAEELSSAASSWSRGTGDSVGERLLTGEKVWADRNSLGRA